MENHPAEARRVGHGGVVGRLDNLPLRAQSPPHQSQREVLIWARSSIATRATEEEVLQKAGEHAKEHGLAPSPELLAQVKSFIEDD
jgi:hypothetical protein